MDTTSCIPWLTHGTRQNEMASIHVDPLYWRLLDAIELNDAMKIL